MGTVVLLIAGVVISILLNLLIIFVILSKGKSINYMDIIIISLATSDLLQAGVGYMIEIIDIYTNTTPEILRLNSSLTSPSPSTSTPIKNPGIEHPDFKCKTSAFTVTFLALTSIFHLSGISIERRFILLHPLKARMWLMKKMCALYVVVPSWLCGLFWSLCPLLGWSSYVVSSRGIHRCSINIPGRDVNHFTYSYNLMFWCYIVPVVVMGYCCNGIRIALNRLRSQQTTLGMPGEMTSLRKKMERRLTLMTVAMIATFLIAWTPYAISLLIVTIGKRVPPTFFSFAAVFAKLSTMYNPVIYMAFMKDFRTRLRKVLHLKPSNTVSPQQQNPAIVLIVLKA